MFLQSFFSYLKVPLVPLFQIEIRQTLINNYTGSSNCDCFHFKTFCILRVFEIYKVTDNNPINL